MLGISLPEFLLIMVAIVVVVGPDQLPVVLKKSMGIVNQAKKYVSEFKQTIENEARSIQEPIESVKKEWEASSKPDTPMPQKKPSDS